MGDEVTQIDFPDFDILNPLVVNGTVIEASAGTGKTFSVAAFVTRCLALDDNLRISEILVTTFTRNAAAELRDRLRRRMVAVERQLRSGIYSESDELAKHLGEQDAQVRAERLARAIREFDTATISTIHSVCARILTMAGLPATGDSDESDIARIVSEVVNDVVVAESFGDHVYDPDRLQKVVTERLSSPTSVLDFSPHKRASGGRTKEQLNADLEHLVTVVEECVRLIRVRTEMKPTFDDMLRRTADLLGDSKQVSLLAALRQRYTLAVIDEAQDTDQLQWGIFSKIFEATSTTHTLLAVGDPKQAIYRFRGADVDAYLAVRRDDKRLTLRRNWRSDSDLIEALNCVFEGWEFGPGIHYVPVVAQPKAPKSCLVGARPLTIVDIGATNSKLRVVKPAARRVREILATVSIIEDGVQRDVTPSDICVLVSSKSTGASIEAELRDLGVSAVSSGTENVIAGEMAVAFERLFKAMDNPYDTSIIRLAAATPFFGHELANAGSLDDEAIEAIQRSIITWTATLRRKGVAALASTLRSDALIVSRIVRGDEGERRETDFAHVIELLHVATDGSGCTPSAVLESMNELGQREPTSETVSRRIESDRDAVQIMTVHAAKGLEFPVVVVADLWKMHKPSRGPSTYHRVAPDDPSAKQRVIDVGYAVRRKDDAATAARRSEESAEVLRLFYVAMTRAKHHVSVIVADKSPTKDDGPRATSGLTEPDRFEEVAEFAEVIRGSAIGSYPRYSSAQRTNQELGVATFDGIVDQTYQRLSFSGIAKKRQGKQAAEPEMDDRSGAGHQDDDEPIISIRSGYASADTDPGVPSMPMARLVGGTYFGKVMHSVYEAVDFAAPDLHAEVSRVVDATVGGAMLRRHRDVIVDGVVLSMRTPLGGSLGDTTLSSVGSSDKLSELSFEMGLADSIKGVTVRDIGRALIESLNAAGRSDDILMPYARELASSAFDIGLMGLMNGSIDTLLRLPSDSGPRLWVTDWKSNRLDQDGMEHLIDGYDREMMLQEMEHHHYPLQAMIYGVSVHRYVRSRVLRADERPVVAGLAYFFIRGMTGEHTPVDAAGNRHGVFTWEAPAGLWEVLSNVMSGVSR